MRLIRLLALAIVFGFAALATLATSPAQSAPVAASSLAARIAATAHIEKIRLYCFNRYTGQFLHWGRCGGYRPYYYRPYRRHYYYHQPRWHHHYSYY